MPVFQEYSAVELYLILEEKKVTVRKIMQLILMDLLVKQVLGIDKQTIEAYGRHPKRNISYIGPGPCFDEHSPIGYESMYLDDFDDKDDAPVVLRDLIRNAGLRIYDRKELVNKTILHQRPVAAYFKHGKIFRLFGTGGRNKKGQQAKREIKEHLLIADAEVLEMTEQDLLNWLNKWDSRIFLLNKQLYKSVGKRLKALGQVSDRKNADTTSGLKRSEWMKMIYYGVLFDSEFNTIADNPIGDPFSGTGGVSI